SAKEMARALTRLEEVDPEYAEWRLRELRNVCNRDLIEHEGNAAIKAGKLAFCKQFEGESTIGETLDVDQLENAAGMGDDEMVEALARQQAGVALNPTERFQREIEKGLEQADSDKRSDAFTRMVRNVRYPDELLILILQNQEASARYGAPIWTLGSESRHNLYPDANLANAQSVALHLYTC